MTKTVPLRDFFIGLFIGLASVWLMYYLRTLQSRPSPVEPTYAETEQRPEPIP